MKHDMLADVFSILKNMEGIGRSEARVPSSTLAKSVLAILQERQYIGSVSSEGQLLKVQLTGRINDCNVIRPRFSVRKDEYIKWEKRFLPANGLGMLLLTTPRGVLPHDQAKEQGVGGQLLGYVY